MLPAGDAELVRIVDAALHDATTRAGHWLACRPGCNQCCTGVFRISQLDAERLRHGLHLLATSDSEAAGQLRDRLRRAQTALANDFPGDVASGILASDEASELAFDDYANDATCPVLDPATGTCTLYDFRPMTCRTFGPPVMTEDGGLGTCELCFQGATEQEVRDAEMTLPAPDFEAQLLAEVPMDGHTIVAYAFPADGLVGAFQKRL